MAKFPFLLGSTKFLSRETPPDTILDSIIPFPLAFWLFPQCRYWAVYLLPYQYLVAS